MTVQEIKSYAADIIRNEFAVNGISVKQIILFGSRSRGDDQTDSDWDFLVCIRDELSFARKAAITTKIQRELAKQFISVDVIIKSEAKLIKERGNVGVITYYALKDGVAI
jgi:uncharacterized protein